MIKQTISKSFAIIKSILTYRKRQKIYLSHLEAAIVQFRMQQEMNKAHSKNINNF